MLPIACIGAFAGCSGIDTITLFDTSAFGVRIGGEVWSARAFAPGQVIPAGAVVDVFEIEGATALVYAEERS